MEEVSEPLGVAGLDIPTKSHFLDTHTAQHVLVLLPKMKSGSRGPPSARPHRSGYPKLLNTRGTSYLYPFFTFVVLGNG